MNIAAWYEGIKSYSGLIAAMDVVGSILAAYLSWGKHHDVSLMVLHAFCDWFYVVYYVLMVR